MRIATLSLLALGLTWSVAVVPQAGVAAQEPPRPSLALPSVAGRDLFQFYCATCHGAQAKGDGPVAASLRVKPADLTRVTLRSGGKFPRERLERFVAGDDVLPSAHGSREMPVWGPIFRSLDPSDRMARARITNLVSYIESLQVK